MNGDRHRPSHILAAGGVVVRREADEPPRVAVVHRTRYRARDGSPGDWALPKGTLEEGETVAAAALREVLEETGCRAEIVGRPLLSEYEVDGVPKLTVFFPMECAEEVGKQDDAEVRSLHWLTAAEARERLTYDSERAVVERAFAPGGGGTTPP